MSGLTNGGAPVNHNIQYVTELLCTIFIHAKALSRQFKRDKLFAKKMKQKA